MKKISAVILTKNEESRIEKTIYSLQFCNEILLIDDNSTDKTTSIAKKLRAIVYQRSLNTDFASQRNYGLEKAKGDWILFIDADEEITSELQKEIKDVIRNDQLPITNYQSNSKSKTQNLNHNQCDAYALRRRDYWLGKELKFGETRKVRNTGIVRLVRKGSGQWFGNVHEVFNTARKVKRLDNFLNHYPHPTISDFIYDINFYSTLRAKELYSHGISTNIIQIIIYPLFKFLLTYFIYFGFLDGSPGFIYSFFMSFHSFLVRAKLYQYCFLNRTKS